MRVSIQRKYSRAEVVFNKGESTEVSKNSPENTHNFSYRPDAV